MDFIRRRSSELFRIRFSFRSRLLELLCPKTLQISNTSEKMLNKNQAKESVYEKERLHHILQSHFDISNSAYTRCTHPHCVLISIKCIFDGLQHHARLSFQLMGDFRFTLRRLKRNCSFPPILMKLGNFEKRMKCEKKVRAKQMHAINCRIKFQFSNCFQRKQ